MATVEAKRECRSLQRKIEVREAKADGILGVLAGYAAVFDKRSEVLYDFVEVVKKGAFTRSLADGADVRFLAQF
jgi:phage head maturation protease